MLYKKYHRDFIRQFKKGVKFVFNKEGILAEVIKEPYIYQNDSSSPQAILLEDKLYTWNLLIFNGRIFKDLYVIQKIS